VTKLAGTAEWPIMDQPQIVCGSGVFEFLCAGCDVPFILLMISTGPWPEQITIRMPPSLAETGMVPGATRERTKNGTIRRTRITTCKASTLPGHIPACRNSDLCDVNNISCWSERRTLSQTFSRGIDKCQPTATNSVIYGQ